MHKKRPLLRCCIAGGLVWLVSACATTTKNHSESPLDAAVISSKAVAIGEMNAKIESAVASNATWTKSATLCVLYVLQADEETRELKLTYASSGGEQPSQATVELRRDGFLDDAVRGDWHRLALQRQADGTWRFVEGSRAQQCWRNSSKGYMADACP